MRILKILVFVGFSDARNGQHDDSGYKDLSAKGSSNLEVDTQSDQNQAQSFHSNSSYSRVQ